jgi:hypothetical protein
VEEFILLSPAPCDTAAKLSAIYREIAETEKERATDLLEAADFCEELTKQLVITSSHIDSPSAILNATDKTETQFIDILIDTEQKMVIAEYVVQQYLQEVWDGGLNWGAGKMTGFFALFVLIPPVWFFFSLPINYRMNKIPIVKFLAYLTGHIYFMLFLCLTAVLPPHSTVRTSLFPHWYEMVVAAWYIGNGLAHYTNPGAKGGLSWVKPLIVFLGLCGFLIHFSAVFVSSDYWSIMMYIRNQFIGTTLLFCWVQILDFLAFHPLFGPWSIIIGECLLDVGKFVVVLSLFMWGYAMLGATMNQPFGLPTDYIDDPELNPNNLTQMELFEEMAIDEQNHPFFMFELHFFALFGNAGYEDMKASDYLQEWTIYAFKFVHASYLTLSIIVLINLLIAMMSDTYCRIQEQSDVEWKFGLAKLIRNMQRTNVAPSPLNLFTTWMVLIRKQYLEIKAERFRAQMKFRRAMKSEIMQKAPGMKFVVEAQEQKKKRNKKKPRVIHALGNMKWGFAPPQAGTVNVDTLQTRWDREHQMKTLQDQTFGGSNVSFDEFRQLSKSISWAAVVRSYMESNNRGSELKAALGVEGTETGVKEIMNSMTNLRLEECRKAQAKKRNQMPRETKTKVTKAHQLLILHIFPGHQPVGEEGQGWNMNGALVYFHLKVYK